MHMESRLAEPLPADAEQPAVQQEHIPQELRRCAQWVCWRYVDRGEGKKPDKQPVNPHSSHKLANAGVHWPNTWTNFEHAYMTYLAYRRRGLRGVGFVLTETDPFVAIDIDNCTSPGVISPEAQAIVDGVHSYTEISPSGHGLRILVTSPGFAGNMRRQTLEIYSHSRFVTMTGHHMDDTPITLTSLCTEEINALIPTDGDNDVKAPAAVLQVELRAQDKDDMALWECIFEHDRFGTQHRRRFHGDTSLDGGDHSLTVIRLLNCLARWTGGDACKMRAMMLLSSLANEKWFSMRSDKDWLEHQIMDSLAYARRVL